MSAYYHIYTESSLEITDQCYQFSFEQSQGKDDMLVLKLRDDRTFSLIDNIDLKKGKKIKFIFGVNGGDQSGYRFARIAGINREYTPNGTIVTLRCLDDGFLMKRRERSDVWRNKTISEIVYEIATRSGLASNIEPTSQRYEYLPQASRTDYAFGKYLAGIEKSGLFRFFIRNGTLYFGKQDYKEESKRLFEFSPKGGIISFQVNEKGNEQGSEAGGVLVKSYDPLTGKKFEKDVSQNESDAAALGDYDLVIDDQGVITGQKPAAAKKVSSGKNSGKTLPVVADSQAETENIGKNMQIEAAIKGIECTLLLALDPTISADQIISIKGLSKTDSGNYYIQSVTHTITGGSFAQTSLKLNRNASNSKQSDGQQKLPNDKNKTVSKEGTKDTKELIKYDENGNEIK